MNNDDDDNNDEYAKVIHQIFPYQEGINTNSYCYNSYTTTTRLVEDLHSNVVTCKIVSITWYVYKSSLLFLLIIILISLGIFANPKPSLSSHSYRSTALPPKKPISTVGADALKFMEKGYEDYQFQEDYGLKEGKQT